MVRLPAILGLITILVILPQVDQLACGFCGPSVETSAVGLNVGLADEECPLNDTVERSSSDSQETDHIHLCTLHSTHLMAASLWSFFVQNVEEGLSPEQKVRHSPLSVLIDHPPQLV